jgi:alpha-L-rhamnosidase
MISTRRRIFFISLMIRSTRLLLFPAFALVSCCFATASVLPVRLRCESTENPLGIDQSKPRLGWRLESKDAGVMQSAYQIEVAGAWDSGKVTSDRSIAIPYGGKALESGKTYHWRVRVWDGKGAVSPWSETAHWTMGKLQPADWSARWIGLPEHPATPDVEGVHVTRASYRTTDGRVERDVTDLMRQVVKDKRLPFSVDFNALGGDPAPNVVKELLVEYTMDGKSLVTRANDFAALSIPPLPPGNAAPWFRGDFDLTGKPEFATVTVHSHAYFELYVNGEKVGDDVLTPAVADAKSQTFTITYDVARLLKPGKNCLGLWMSKGWAERVAVRAQLDALVDGQKVTFGTGPDWKTRPSGYSHIGKWHWGDFGGERIDAAAHLPDWSMPGIETDAWANAVEAAAPQGAPVNLVGPLNRIGERISAKTITALADGRYEIDFGTNLTGWLHLKFPPLKAGQLVRLHFADRIFPEGVHASPIGNITVHGGSCISFPREGGGNNLYQIYKQTSEFVSAGAADEEFQHKFNYAGFRYVVIEGLDSAPRVENATALLVESALADAGSFECSDPLLNRIHQANRWTIRALNLGGYYVDCPHRERMGYGDGQVAVQGMMMNFDASHFYSKWVRDWRLALEKKHEHLPYIAPPFEKTGGGPPWPGGIARIPWQHFLHYGDLAILEENITAARDYCEYLDSRSTHDVLRAWGAGFSFIGDWVPPNRGMDTSNWPSQQMAEFFCNCYRVHLWQLVAKMADALGRKDEAEHARSRADAIGKATHAAFFDAANKCYVIDEQIYYAFPLLVGIAPESEREALQENLTRCIVEKNKGHLDTGMLGTMLLIEHLRKAGRDDLILGIYQKKDYPGWGYMVEQGATTLWEQWNGHWSQIHSCFTSADNWLYEGLAGIRPDPAKPGFKNVIIQPAIVGDITWAKAHHDGPYGRITSHWKREGNQLTMEVTIPPNSSATVHVPGNNAKANGRQEARVEKGVSVFSVGAGSHKFVSSL